MARTKIILNTKAQTSVFLPRLRGLRGISRGFGFFPARLGLHCRVFCLGFLVLRLCVFQDDIAISIRSVSFPRCFRGSLRRRVIGDTVACRRVMGGSITKVHLHTFSILQAHILNT